MLLRQWKLQEELTEGKIISDLVQEFAFPEQLIYGYFLAEFTGEVFYLRHNFTSKVI